MLTLEVDKMVKSLSPQQKCDALAALVKDLFPIVQATDEEHAADAAELIRRYETMDTTEILSDDNFMDDDMESD